MKIAVLAVLMAVTVLFVGCGGQSGSPGGSSPSAPDAQVDYPLTIAANGCHRFILGAFLGGFSPSI